MRNLWTHFPWFTGHPETPRIETDKYGVSLLSAQNVVHFTWHEVAQIDAFKRDHITVDEVIFEFRLKSPGKVVLISEEFSDFEKLVRFLESEWPKISRDWRSKVIKPAFAEGRTTLFPIPA